jgi:hypothetical protein
MNLHDLKLRARALFAPNRAERDLHDELSFHIEREAMKLMDQGLPPEDARARSSTTPSATSSTPFAHSSARRSRRSPSSSRSRLDSAWWPLSSRS